MAAATAGHATVGDLRMYHEIHGSGPPLVLLHGAYMTVDMLGPLLEGLAAHRRVIAPELQGHGRTDDLDRPLSYEQMADDTAELMRHLGAEPADVVGYSMGAGVALQLAIRHPALVRRLVPISGSYSHAGVQPEAAAMFPSITPEMFAGSPMEQAYQALAPDPAAFPELVRKLTALDSAPFAWPEDDVRAIPAPTLIVVGDADVVTLEHTVAFFRLRGGGAMGDLAGLPEAQLAVLPGTTHFIPPGSGVLDRTPWLLAMILPFLDREPAADG